MSKKKEKTLRITLSKSLIGSNQIHRATIQALGLKKIHQTVEHKDNPAVRGMIQRVNHLVTVEED